MSASSSGSRSAQRSARLRMFRVATCRRSIAVRLRLAAARARRGAPGEASARGRGRRDRDRERERRALALLGLDPDPPAVPLDDVAGDRQPEARSRRPPRSAGTVDLVEALEDPRPVGLRDPDAVVRDRRHDLRRRPRRTRDPTSPPSGLNLTALWTRLTNDLAEPRLVAADRRQAAARGATTSVTPWRSANRRSRSDGVLGEPRRGRRRRRARAVPPLSMRARSSSSLTIWTRWPVSTSILRDPLAHPRPGPRRRRPPHRGPASRRAG